MKPSAGRIVMVFADPADNNGADVAPAVITRVWSDETINVHVLPDGPDSYWLTSVQLHDTREQAQAAHDRMFATWPAAPSVPYRAFWPPRVEHQPGDWPPRVEARF